MNRNDAPSIEHQSLIRNALENAIGSAEWNTLTPITRGMSGAHIYEVEVNYTFYVAAQDSLYLDPATCVNYFYYDNADTAQHFLERCFGGALTETQQHKLHLMRIASLINIGTNFLLMFSKSNQALLSSDECQQLPSYSEYMKLIGVSKHFSEPIVLQEYGFVCFKEMQRLVEQIEA